VGLEELEGIEYGTITEGMVRSIFGLLGPALSKAMGTKRLTKEENMATASMTLFTTLPVTSIYICWTSYYICMASEKSGIAVHFLVTDDHAFFKAFIKSEVAESVLRNEVKAVLAIRKAVHVKLAGEVIPGM
jgi:uncharacterized protein YpmB